MLKRGPQRYLYFFGESTGNTTYRTPFFGSTSYAVVAGTIVTVPLHSTEMSFLDPSKGDVIASLLLPLEEREFDRREIDRYRDALLETAGDGASANRIRSAFDGIEPPGRGDLVILVERDDLGVETVLVRPVIRDPR